MNAKLRLLLSALVSMVVYGIWTYWANSLSTNDQAVLIKAALSQAALSGTVTVLFTLGLERTVNTFGARVLSLMFVTPILCTVHSKTPQNLAIFKTFRAALDQSARYFDGAKIPGTVLAPLLPLFVQATLAIGVHLWNQTPNIPLTVAPNIFFTALYGYLYTFTLLRE